MKTNKQLHILISNLIFTFRHNLQKLFLSLDSYDELLVLCK